MYINQVFEISKGMDNEEFRKALSRAPAKAGYLEKREEEFIDHSLDAKGMTVIYQNSQYKKRVKVLVNLGYLLGSKECDPKNSTKKIGNYISEYFGFKYRMDDFALSGSTFIVDINVGDDEKVSAYLKVLQRIGKVKGFSPVSYGCFDENASFCLEGNSNGIGFLLYNLKGMLMNQLKQSDVNRKGIKQMVKISEGILRAEVRLTKPKSIRMYTNATDIRTQIIELVKNNRDIFLGIITQVIPFGDYYKKIKAIEIIQKEVKDDRLRRKMLRYITLIPEKKSIYLAQKAMNCRNMEKVVDVFAKINVSPVTISKRNKIKYLRNIYGYLM